MAAGHFHYRTQQVNQSWSQKTPFGREGQSHSLQLECWVGILQTPSGMALTKQRPQILLQCSRWEYCHRIPWEQH